MLSGSFFDTLLKDPLINRLSGKKPISGGNKLPENLVAKVLSTKGELSVLKWPGGVFTATLNAKVTPGETLLLKYNGLKNDRSHYRIINRFISGADAESTTLRNSSEPLLFGLMPPADSGEQNRPALVRFVSPREREKRKSASEQEPLLELMIDTESFGLVMVQFFSYQGNRLECQFLVESKEAGRALQYQAKQLIVEAGGTKEEQQGEPIRWTVGALQKDIARILHESGLSLNTQA